jgi:hypothetical protein
LAFLIGWDLIEIHLSVGLSITVAARFQTPGHVAYNAVKKGAEAATTAALDVGEHAASLEAFDEHVLHGVIEILKVRGISPACGEIGADNRLIAPGEGGALGRTACRRCGDDGPAGTVNP